MSEETITLTMEEYRILLMYKFSFLVLSAGIQVEAVIQNDKHQKHPDEVLKDSSLVS